MSFGLKNAGATYQRAMQRCLHDQLGRNMEAYVDDVVIKSQVKEDLISDLSKTFANLRRFRWILNPEKKCLWSAFGETARLHRVISWHRSQPGEAQGYTQDVQKLTGCMAALNRFVSRL